MYISAIFTGIVLACSAFLILKWIRAKKLRLPPGPPGWPLIGNLPVLFQDPGSTNDQYYYTRCAKQYGDIYKLTFGPQMLYILCKFEYVREAFNHSYLQGRPPGVAYPMVFGPEAKGILLVSGEEWKVMKQFTAGVFRDLGVGKGVFETKIQSELERFVNKLDSELGVTCESLMESFCLAVSNITCGITFGRQYNYEDSKFREVIGIMKTFSKSMGPSAIVATNRILCGLPFGPGKTLRSCLVKFKDFIELEIQAHGDDFSANKMSNNFIDAFQGEYNKEDKNFNKENLIACCMELFFSGTETSSRTLSFAILCLVVNPTVQEKVQRELDAYIKENGMPCYADRSKLPYLQSVILETHRLLIVAPLGMGHVAERDVELFGYDVPKGTILAANMGSLFMNPNMFPDPKAFKPERYLKDGEFDAIPDIIPFSTGYEMIGIKATVVGFLVSIDKRLLKALQDGRRACLGEQLARMEIFHFLVCLLHRYTFTPPEGIQMPSILEGSYGGTRMPLPYAVVMSKRHVK